MGVRVKVWRLIKEMHEFSRSVVLLEGEVRFGTGCGTGLQLVPIIVFCFY